MKDSKLKTKKLTKAEKLIAAITPAKLRRLKKILDIKVDAYERKS